MSRERRCSSRFIGLSPVPDPVIADLVFKHRAREKLWGHGLRPRHVKAVLRNIPLFVWQDEREVPAEPGWLRIQPRRIKMVGPDDSGRLLTAILEPPDHEGATVVVTAYPSSAGDRMAYWTSK